MTTETNIEKHYGQCTIEKLDTSEVRIVADVPVSVVEKKRGAVIKKLLQSFELDGFRKGHVPEHMLLEKIGEQGVLEEIAEHVLAKAYIEIVQAHDVDVVGQPRVSVTKLAPGNPIEFTITVAVYPDVSLPDYRSIAETVRKNVADPDSVSVSAEDVQKELERLHEMMTKRDATGDDAEREKKAEVETVDVPLDDAFAQKMGHFSTLDDLREKIREGMLMDKKQKAREKRRLAIVDAILEKVHVSVPDVFVDGELKQMFAEFSDRVTRAGMRMEEYLEQIQKTKENILTEWKADAEKRAVLQVVLSAIAKQENVDVDSSRLEREVAHIKEHYPDADEEQVRVYVVGQMRNEAVFSLLEGDAGEKKKQGDVVSS